MIDGTRFTVTVPAAQLATAGIVIVIVENPARGGGPAGAMLTVSNPTLAFVTQPSGAVAGSAFISQPVVEVRRGDGSVLTDYTGTVTITMTAGAGGTLSGPDRVSLVNGRAMFSGLSVNTAGMGHVLTAALNLFGIVTVERVPFTVNNPPPIITGLNPHPITTGDMGVTLTVTGTGFEPGSVVKWNGVSLATSYAGPAQLTAAVPDGFITTPSTANITVAGPLPGDPASGAMTLAIVAPVNSAGPRLAFMIEPNAIPYFFDSLLVDPIVVEVRRADGSVWTGFDGTVTLSIKSGTGAPGATLSGVVTVTVVSGYATFTDLVISSRAAGYVLIATSRNGPLHGKQPRRRQLTARRERHGMNGCHPGGWQPFGFSEPRSLPWNHWRRTRRGVLPPGQHRPDHGGGRAAVPAGGVNRVVAGAGGVDVL